MSEQNKALVRQALEEIWNEANPAAADELIAAECTVRDPSTPGEFRGPDGVRQFKSIYRAAFPDLHYASDDLIAEGDTVVMRWHVTGTHQGDLPGVPATKRRITVTGVTTNRIRGGKIASIDVVWDTYGLLKQLGALPEMASA